jgi:hypothetical protein
LVNEQPEEFAGRVQKLTADVLQIGPTSWSKKDALEYRKRLMSQSNKNNNNNNKRNTSQKSPFYFYS